MEDIQRKLRLSRADSSRGSRIFLKRGPLSCEIPGRKPARFSGGGVVAEFFHDIRRPARFTVGGE